MSIKKQAQVFQRQELVYFTGTMTEVENQTQGGKPKKETLPDYLHQVIKTSPPVRGQVSTFSPRITLSFF